MSLADLALYKVGANVGAAKIILSNSDFSKQANEGLTFDNAWDWVGNNKYTLGAAGLGALAGAYMGGPVGAAGVGLLGAGAGWLLNTAGSSNQNMGFMDRINVLTDGWKAYQNMGNMSQGAQDALKGHFSQGGQDTGMLGQFKAWTAAPQQYRDIAANPEAMGNLNTVLGDKDQAGRLGKLTTFNDQYSAWSKTPSYQHFGQMMNIPTYDDQGNLMDANPEIYNSNKAKLMREGLASHGITPDSLGGLAGNNLSKTMADPNSVGAMQGYLNMTPDQQNALGTIMKTKTVDDFDNATGITEMAPFATSDGNNVDFSFPNSIEDAKNKANTGLELAKGYFSNKLGF